MLKHRLMTAAIGLPSLLAFLIFAPRQAVFGLMLACVALSVFEVAQMFLPALSARVQRSSASKSMSFKWSLFCVAIGLMLFVVSTTRVPGAERGGIVLAMTVLLVAGTFSARSIDRSIVHMAGFLLSVCYGCLPWLSVWDLYLMGDGASHLLVALAVVMLSDTGAYFVGRRFGKHPLAPSLSPKKTREGFVGGLVSSMIGVQILNALYGFTIGPVWLLVVCSLFGGVAGVLGDLIESAFKRFAEVKDSGAIFPGHGGFLDRTDSLLVAAPVVWFIFYCHQWLG